MWSIILLNVVDFARSITVELEHGKLGETAWGSHTHVTSRDASTWLLEVYVLFWSLRLNDLDRSFKHSTLRDFVLLEAIRFVRVKLSLLEEWLIRRIQEENLAGNWLHYDCSSDGLETDRLSEGEVFWQGDNSDQVTLVTFRYLSSELEVKYDYFIPTCQSIDIVLLMTMPLNLNL